MASVEARQRLAPSPYRRKLILEVQKKLQKVAKFLSWSFPSQFNWSIIEIKNFGWFSYKRCSLDLASVTLRPLSGVVRNSDISSHFSGGFSVQ